MVDCGEESSGCVEIKDARGGFALFCAGVKFVATSSVAVAEFVLDDDDDRSCR